MELTPERLGQYRAGHQQDLDDKQKEHAALKAALARCEAQINQIAGRISATDDIIRALSVPEPPPAPAPPPAPDLEDDDPPVAAPLVA